MERRIRKCFFPRLVKPADQLNYSAGFRSQILEMIVRNIKKSFFLRLKNRSDDLSINDEKKWSIVSVEFPLIRNIAGLRETAV